MKAFLLAVLSGLLLTACFPPLGWTWLVWVWPWPLLSVLWGHRPTGTKRSGWIGFRNGFYFGLTFFIASLIWIREVDPMAILGLAALATYLALYPAVWGSLIVRFAGSPNLRNVMLAAGWWAGLEWLRGLLLTGFGWHQLGIALHTTSWLMQPAEWIGSAGLSFLILCVSGSIYVSIATRAWVKPVVFATAMVAVWIGLGYFLEHRAIGQESKTIQVLLAQSNILQADKWADMVAESEGATLPEAELKAVQERIMKRYDQLHDFTKLALDQGPLDLVVWPESSLHYPLHFDLNKSFLDTVAQLGNFTLAFGCDVYEDQPYNSLVALKGSASDPSIFRKVHLVAFGEYIPLREELPFLETIAGNLVPMDFQPGKVIEPLQIKGETMELIPTVCFEDTVPRHVRKFIREGSQIIVNVANDAWFNESAQQEQHFWNSRLRAVELRRPMVRSANTGVTFALSNTGALLGRLEKYQAGSVRVAVPVAVSGGKTFYASYGDVFSAIVGLLALIGGVITSRSGGR